MYLECGRVFFSIIIGTFSGTFVSLRRQVVDVHPPFLLSGGLQPNRLVLGALPLGARDVVHPQPDLVSAHGGGLWDRRLA